MHKDEKEKNEEEDEKTAVYSVNEVSKVSPQDLKAIKINILFEVDDFLAICGDFN